MSEKWTAAVVDDEPRGRQGVELLLAKHCPEVEVIARYASAMEALNDLPSKRPDILFLDIDMPGMNGFELLDHLSEGEFKTIFVTAHDQYAIRAFKYLAVDYLLKPVDASALKEAVRKAGTISFSPARQKMLVEQMRHPEKLPEVIALPMAYGLELITVADIMYCLADGNYTAIHRLGKARLLVSRQLKEFENLLGPQGFFRVHNSAVVNIRHVVRFVRTEGTHLEMSDGVKVEVSKSRKEEFLRHLQRV